MAISTIGTNGLDQTNNIQFGATGNVGIGTNSPALKLDVSMSSAGDGIRVYNTLSTGYADVRVGNNTNNNLGFLRVGGSAQGGIYQNAFVIGTGGGFPITFAPNSTEAMRIDSSGNVGIGITPSAWAGGFKAMQYLGGSVSSQASGYLYTSQNAYYNGTNWTYSANGGAVQYEQSNAQHQWKIAGYGTAGNAITFTQAMTLDSSGNLSNIGTINSNRPLGGGSYDGVYKYANSGNVYTYSDGAYLAAYTANTERMRIDSSGNLLIGTSSTSGNIGSVYNYSKYALALETIVNDVGYYTGTCKRISAYLGNTGDPALGYVILCPAYTGTAKAVSAFTGTISKRRGAPFAGLIVADCYISVASGYVQNLGGGVNFGGTGGWTIVTCVYGGATYIAIRSSTSLSSSSVTIDGIYTDDFTPILVSDGSVSSVTVITSF